MGESLQEVSTGNRRRQPGGFRLGRRWERKVFFDYQGVDDNCDRLIVTNRDRGGALSSLSADHGS